MNVDLMTGGDLSKHMCIDDDRLILIKGEDKTKQVAFWRHDDSNEYVLITYKRYPDKEYHSTKEQKERDAVKNTILEKYKIPIVRFNTVESSERDRLIEALIKTTEQQTVLA